MNENRALSETEIGKLINKVDNIAFLLLLISGILLCGMWNIVTAIENIKPTMNVITKPQTTVNRVYTGLPQPQEIKR